MNTTALQNHLAFFDRQIEENGTVTLAESRQGLRALGLSPLVSDAVAVAAHVVLGPATSHRLTTDIDMGNLPAAKHPSDSDIFAADGSFDQARFNERFSRFDANRSGALSRSEIATMIQVERDPGVMCRRAHKSAEI